VFVFVGFSVPAAYLPDNAIGWLGDWPAAFVFVFGCAWLVTRLILLPMAIVRRVRRS
jgi:hypothetical protein